MNDVAAFVLARLAEDEQAARAAYDEASDYRVVGSELAELHFVRHKPDRVLAQVAALRAVVELAWHDFGDEGDPYDDGIRAGHADAKDADLRLLARIWADHPDYDPAWT